MKVVCRRLASGLTGEPAETSPWLTVGREYDVLEIEAYPEREILLRILDDGEAGGPGVWDSRLFEVVSGALPSTWTVALGDGGALIIGPAAWRREGFWEDYFDRDPDAVSLFDDALRAMQRR